MIVALVLTAIVLLENTVTQENEQTVLDATHQNLPKI